MTEQDSNTPETDQSSAEGTETVPEEMPKKVKATLISLAVNPNEKDESGDSKNITIRSLMDKNAHCEVFRGENSAGKQRAVVTSVSEAPEVVDEFVKFVRANFPLKHPNIAKVFECVVIDEKRYAVCELLEAVSLKDVIASAGAFDTKEEFYHIINQIIEAIRYAHGLGVIHGSLKPSNVLLCELDSDVQIKISDFGKCEFKRISLEKQRLLLDPVQVSFWSPEHCNDEPITEASDVYQIGLLAYFMLTGKLAYDYANAEALIKAHTDKRLKPEPIAHDANDIANVDELAKIIMAAIDSDSEWRIDSLNEFSQRLNEWYRAESNEIDLEEMTLDDMLKDAEAKGDSPVTPRHSKKISTTVHNLVALKKKQVEQEQTVIMQFSDKVSGGARLSPVKAISKVGVLSVLLVIMSGTFFFIYTNHSDDVHFLWNEASMKIGASTADLSQEDEDIQEEEEVDEATTLDKTSTETVKKGGGKKGKINKVAKSKYKKRTRRKKNFMKASDYYQNLRYGVDSNELRKQGKSNRRVIDYKEFDMNWLK